VAADAEPRAAAVGAAEVASSGRLDPTRHAIALVLCCPLISLLRPCAGTAACAGSALHAELSLHREARPPRHVGRGGPAAPCWETFPAAGETGRAAAAEVLAPAAFRSLGAVDGGDDGIIAPAAWAPGEAACRRLRALRTHVTPQRAHGTAAAAGAQLAGFGAQQGKLIAEHCRRWGFVVVQGVLPPRGRRRPGCVAAPSTPSALRAPTPARSPSPTPAQDDARTHLSPEQTSRCLMYGSPRLLGALQSIYGPDFVPFAESLALMQPDTGAAFQFHQDAFGLNVGIYLSPSTRSNGCLWAIPGSHTGGRLNVPAPASPPPPCRPR
jgi:hypothetical protein